MINLKELKIFWYSDFIRYGGSDQIPNFKRLLVRYLVQPGYHYTFWMRLSKYLKYKKYLLPLYLLSFANLQRLKYKFGIDISSKTEIGTGFYIGHFGGIVVNSNARIGKNCNISQGVTIGMSNRWEKQGTATIGDNVYIGPGAKIVGAVSIGNNVAVGANAVVTKDVPDSAVVAGVPAKIISMKGSEGYVVNYNYSFLFK